MLDRAKMWLANEGGLLLKKILAEHRFSLEIAAKEKDEFINRFRQVYLLLGSSAAVVFATVDYFYSPEMFQSFLYFRLFAIFISISAWYSYRLDFFRKKHYTWPAYYAAIYLSSLHWYLIFNSGNEKSPHIGGLVLATVFLVGNLPWTFRQACVLFAIMWTPFFGTLSTLQDTHFPTVVANFFMFKLSIFCSLTFLFITWIYRAKEYRHKQQLETRNQEQARIIDEKTKEGIYLEKLANQFSPQVIHSIKDGTIDLESRLRRQVAVIFIDVENSTVRSNRLDHQNYSSLLADFFSECVRILLRHNVTVGTFQGDGIMAFSNAPSDDNHFRENSLHACLEILQFHEKMKDVYFEKWRTDFNIRIGLDAGWATVGFFPSRERGTYTALGDCTNLAARLCSRAPVNSIAATQTFLNSLNLQNGIMHVQSAGQWQDIKGFEGEAFEIFTLRPVIQVRSLKNICPSCDEKLEIFSHQVGGALIRCPKCDYRKVETDGGKTADQNILEISPFKKRATGT